MALTDMTRRSFTKLAALAGAAATVGISADSIKPAEKAYAEGQDEVVEQKTFCRACPRDCGVIATIRNGKVVKVRGNPDDTISGGTMCAKGLSAVQALYHPNRTKYPMKRVGERGVDNTWERISWEEAIDMLANALHTMAEKTGRNGLLCTAGGGGNPKFFDTIAFRDYWGAGNIFEPGAAQCRMPRSFVQKRMIGLTEPGAIGDGGGQQVFNPLHPCSCLVQWGAGGAQSSPAQMGRNFVAMRENGGGFINVDPRFTIDSARADVWLPIRPGTDVFMMNAWIKWLIDNEKYNEEFVRIWTNAPFLVNPDDNDLTLLRASTVADMEAPNGEAYVYYDEKTGVTKAFALGPDNEADYNPVLEGTFDVPLADGRTVKCKTAFTLLREYVEDYTLEKAAEVCWTPIENIERALEMFGNADDSRSVSSGVSLDQYIQSTENAQALAILNILVGNTMAPGSCCTTNTSIRNRKYEWGKEKGVFSNVGRDNRFEFNPNKTKDGKQKQYLNKETGEMEDFFYTTLEDVQERLGYVEHKGLGYWQQSQIPAVHHAMLTGDPYPVKVWMERSGNKMATIADSSSWLEAFKNLDFCSHAYMYPTSFTFEAADVIFPITEWIESSYPADSHGAIAGVKVSCTNLFEQCDDRFIWGTVFKALADNYGDERAYHVIYDDDEYYTIYDYDQYLKDISIKGMTWEETKQIGAYADLTPEEYWEGMEKDYYSYKKKVGDDGLYQGFYKNEANPISARGIKDEARKQQMFHDYLVQYGRQGDDPQGPLPPASVEYLPYPVYIEPADYADEEIRAKYPLVCSNGRLPYFHHTTLRNIPFLRETYPAPELWIDPQSAAERGIETGDWVNVTSKRCEENEAIKDGIYAVAWVTSAVNPGCCYMERWWNPEFLEKGQDARKSWTTSNYNVLSRRAEPHNACCGTYTLRGINIEVRKASKPEGVWYEALDFEPWMPEYTENTGGGYNR